MPNERLERLVARVAREVGCSRNLVEQVIHTFFTMRMADQRKAFEARGGRWGRPSKIPAETRARARRLNAGGKSIRGIAKVLGLPKSTVERLLKKM